MKIYLTGFMGAGKTTLGRLLADRLGRDFVNLDEAIEAAEGLSVARIFEERGEEHFRRAEAAALRSAAEAPGRAVVACGGGTPCNPANRDLMAATGITVWLDRPFDAIWHDREELARTRPLLRRRATGHDDPAPDAETALRDLWAGRRAAYEPARVHVPVGEAGVLDTLEVLRRLLREAGVPG